MTAPTTDPPQIRISTFVYSLLLNAYPRKFQREYGPHMVQVFRDSCKQELRTAGAPGLGWLWLRTLADWVKSVVAEQLNRETDMTRSRFIRLSGWGLMLSSVALILAILSDETTIRTNLYWILGPPLTAEAFGRYTWIAQSIGVWMGGIGELTLIFGLLGLRLKYNPLLNRFGRECLSAAVFCGTIALAGAVGLVYNDVFWLAFSIGLVIQFSALAGFAISALQTRLLPHWNALPMMAGLYFPAVFLVGGLVQAVMGVSWVNPPFWIETPLTILCFSSLAMLGYRVQRDQTPAAD